MSNYGSGIKNPEPEIDNQVNKMYSFMSTRTRTKNTKTRKRRKTRKRKEQEQE